MIVVLLALLVIAVIYLFTRGSPRPTSSMANDENFRVIRDDPPSHARTGESYHYGRYKQGIANPDILAPMMRLKRWHYVSITTDTHMVAAAIIDLQFVANAWVYLIDLNRPSIINEFRVLSPLSRRVQMADSSINPGSSRWSDGEHYIQISQSNRSWKVEFDVMLHSTEFMNGSSIKLPGISSLSGQYQASISSDDTFSLLYPLDYSTDRAAYTHKAAGLSSIGSVMFNRKTIDLIGLGCIDYTRSYASRVTMWKWCNFACSARDAMTNATVRLGVNISADVYLDTENVVFVDGKVHPLGPVDFVLPFGTAAQWSIRSSSMDGAATVDLWFIPTSSKQEHVNALIIEDEFSQSSGLYTGFITLNGRVLAIEHAAGVAEKHYARW